MTAVVALAAVIAPAAWRSLRDEPASPSLPAGRLTAPGAPGGGAAPWSGGVLAAVVSDGRQRAVDLVPTGGGAARRLVAGLDDAEAPAWSPDGTALAFAARVAGNWDVYVVARGGGTPRRLTDDAGFDGWPAWSPDGRTIAFVSSRDGAHTIYAVPADGAAAPVRLSPGEEPAIEPAWSPDGRAVAYAAWHEGAYRLESVDAEGAHRVVAEPDGRADLRSPAWSPDGTRLAWLVVRHGVGQVVVAPWPVSDRHDIVAVEATAFTWIPRTDGLAVVVARRDDRRVEAVTAGAIDRQPVAMLAPGRGGVAWSAGPMPDGLTPGGTPVPTVTPAAVAHVGLADLADVDAPGARIHAALADDFAALRAEVRAETGHDFLGTLSDAWRPLGFKSSGSAFFSWHKVGRAFDTDMDLRGPGGRRDLLLVREGDGGRVWWRMHLRAAVQDGSVGRPLVEPGWTFSAGGGDDRLEATGGERGGRIPDGYWVDFTDLAERHGWRRISSRTGSDLDWRTDWAALEWWHYERRDALSWFAAARQVYAEEDLVAALDPSLLRDRDVPTTRLGRLGFPPGWPGEG